MLYLVYFVIFLIVLQYIFTFFYHPFRWLHFALRGELTVSVEKVIKLIQFIHIIVIQWFISFFFLCHYFCGFFVSYFYWTFFFNISKINSFYIEWLIFNIKLSNYCVCFSRGDCTVSDLFSGDTILFIWICIII